MRKLCAMITVTNTILALATCVLSPVRVSAQEDAMQAKVDRLLEQLGNLEFGLGATGIVQGAMNNGDNNPDEGNTTDANWSLDFEVGAPIGNHGRVFVLIEAGQGNGVTDEPGIADSFFGVNDDAGDSAAGLDVTEAWYEHTLWGERAVFTIGKIDLTNYFDTNEVANDETVQFLSTGLVNSIVVAFPDDNGTGARLTVSPVPWLDLSFGWGESDADFEDVFKDPFFIWEVGIKPLLAKRQGHYRLYAWWNTTELERFDAPGDTKRNWGVGVSVDQQLLDPLAVFFRVAFQQAEVSEVELAWSTGLQLLGAWWRRPDDAVAFAIGQARLSSDFEASAAAPLRTDDELFVEMYYRVALNDNLAVSLHVQVIDNSGGNRDFDPITVVGGRAQVNF